MNNVQSKEGTVIQNANVMHYRGWDIAWFAIPSPDGQWSVNCEIDKTDAHGKETFQGALPTFAHAEKDQAVHAACEDAKHHIDDIIANPLG